MHPPKPSPPAFERLERALEAEDASRLGWLSAQPTRVKAALTAVAAVAIPALVFLVMPRPDLADYPVARLVLDALVVVVPAVVVVFLLLRPIYRPAPSPGLRVASVLGVCVGALVLANLPHAHGNMMSMVGNGPHDTWPLAMGCLSFGLFAALPSALALLTLTRGRRPELALAAASAMGVLAVQAQCPIITHKHMFLGHTTIALVGVLLGVVAWFGALALGRRD